MLIRYGINKTVRKPHKPKKIIHENHTTIMMYPTTNKMLKYVQENHKGWNLSGYCYWKKELYGEVINHNDEQ